MIRIKKLFNKIEHNKFLFAVFMIIIFILVDFLTVGFSGLFDNWSGIVIFINNIASTTDAGSSIFPEVIWGLCLLVVLLLSGNKYIFSQKKIPFKERLKVMWPMIVASVLLLIQGFHGAGGFANINLHEIAAMVVLYFFVGVYEEFLCRGWLLNEFMERFGDTRKGVIYSLMISALIFGFMHVTNIVVGYTVAETIPQIIMAFAVGVCYGAIYLKTKNIWSVVFLHGFYDFSVSIGEMNKTTSCFTASITDEYIGAALVVTMIVSTLINLFVNSPGIFQACKLLTKKNCNDLITGEKLELTENDIKTSNTVEKVFNILNIVVLSLLGLITLLSLVVSYEPDSCNIASENVKKISNYEITTISYNNYDITYSEEKTYPVNCINPELVCDPIIYNIDKTLSFDIVDNSLVISNEEEEVTLDYVSIYNFGIYDSGSTYEIMLIDQVETGSIVYYLSLPYSEVEKTNVLTYIKDNMEVLGLPTTIKIGYLTENNIKMPLFVTRYNSYYVIDTDGELKKLV